MEDFTCKSLGFILQTMYEHLAAKPHGLHSLSVMPAGVSGHPVFEFEMLDSRVNATGENRLDLWRENDGTNFEGPRGLSQALTNFDCL